MSKLSGSDSGSDSTNSNSSSSNSDRSRSLSDFEALQLEDSNPAMSSKDTEIDNTGASTIGKGTNKNYVPCVTFPSMIAAKAGIANREIGGQLWTRSVSYSTNEGDKVTFTCNGHPKCPKRMQLLLDPESQDVLASVSADEHQHTSFSSRTRLNPESKAKVIEWLSNGVTKPFLTITNSSSHFFLNLKRAPLGAYFKGSTLP